MKLYARGRSEIWVGGMNLTTSYWSDMLVETYDDMTLAYFDYVWGKCKDDETLLGMPRTSLGCSTTPQSAVSHL